MTSRNGERDEMGSARRVVLAAGLIAVLTIAATACGSGGGSTTPKTRPQTTTSTAVKVKGVQVNLMLSGDRTAVVTGSKGTCTIPAFGQPTYEFSGDDYPSLGPDGSIRVVGPIVVANGGRVPAAVKVLIGDVGLLTPPADDSGITVSSNKRNVTLDADVAGGPGVTEDINLQPPNSTVHAHLSGTIRCT